MKRQIESGRAQAGFSMIEILIAMAIMALVLAGLITVFANQQRTFGQSTETSKAQAAARASLSLITRDIRMAGYSGIPLGFDELSRQGLLYPIITNGDTSGAAGGAIEIMGNFSRRTTTLSNAITAGDSSVSVTDIAVFEGQGISAPAAIIVGNANRLVEFHTYSASTSMANPISAGSWTRDFDTLETVAAPFMRRRYWVDAGSHELMVRNCDTLDVSDGCPSGAETVMAEGIERIEFTYDLTDTAGGSLTSGHTIVCDPCRIRTVHIRLWTRTPDRLRPGNFINFQFSSAVRIRNIGFETTTCPVSGCVAP